MDIKNLMPLIEKDFANLTTDEKLELRNFFKTMDLSNTSTEEFVKIIQYAILNSDDLDLEDEYIFKKTYNIYRKHFNSLQGIKERNKFSKDIYIETEWVLDVLKLDNIEELVDTAIESEDVNFQGWLYICCNYDDGQRMRNPSFWLWKDESKVALAAKIVALGINWFEEGIQEEFQFIPLWMGSICAHSPKIQAYLNEARILHIDFPEKFKDWQALQILSHLKKVGDEEAEAYFINYLLKSSTPLFQPIRNTMLAEMMVRGAIDNKLVNLALFEEASQSIYLRPAPFKILKAEMKAGNDRATVILQTILTKKSWKRLTAPKKRGKLAWIWRKLTGQGGRFVPKPQKK